MREGVRRHVAAGLLLQPVIADGGRGGERFVDVALLEDVTAAIGVIRPDAGIAVRLQLDSHRQRVGIGFARLLAQLLHLFGRAHEVLHVVTDLVRDDVRLREVARRVEALAQLAIEIEVNVYLAIPGTIERPHRGFRETAGRLRGAAEEHELRHLVFRAGLPEYGRPGVLRVRQHGRDEVDLRVHARGGRRSRRRGIGSRIDGHVLQQRGGIDAQEVGDDEHDEYRAEPAADEPAAADRHAAPVLDVLAASAFFPAHAPSSVGVSYDEPVEDFEKLGVFYLGKRLDGESGRLTDDLVLYDSADLTTHAVIIGMTGSGKTGLGIGLIEEAALDHVPVIAIDPKGDLGNLLLSFPDLAPADFAPWVDPRAAAEAGQEPQQFAAAQAVAWKKGLAEWGQGPERIARLRAAADFAIYTPGSTAGAPLSVLKEFAPPPAELAADADLYRERVQSTTTGLLTLLGIDADPLTSREHILVASVLDHAWRQGQALDLAALIGAIQKPPFARLGVLDLESFFPARERQSLALRVNNLLAAPGFDAWTQGEALSADRLLFTAAGQPRVSVVSIAHLSDAQRMFFVTLLLAELIAWMRRQPGTPSLRAVLYMDEVFGYMPPVANPPAKLLLLTLLKQARAFGLGVVLATQNPVDLDYKGLANAGTWFIGRLQTERDKARVLDGLLGASGAEQLDAKGLEKTLASLGKRQFLLHNVNEEHPVVFATRWVMSYLAGPLTREQIRALCAGRQAPAPSAATAPAAPRGAARTARPVLPAAVRQFFVPASRLPHGDERLLYQPRVMAAVAAVYVNTELGIHSQRECVLAAQPPSGAGGVDWSQAEELNIAAKDLEKDAEPDAAFGELTDGMASADSYQEWDRQLRRWLGMERALTLYKSTALGVTSKSGESERDFRIRLQQLGNERRDVDAAKVKAKYASRFAALQARELRASQARDRQAEQARDAKLSAAVSVGTAVLGAIFGRGRSLGSASRIGTAVRRTGSIARESGDVARAAETLAEVQAAKDALQAEFQRELDSLAGRFDAQGEPLQAVAIRPRASDIDVRFIGVGWVPYVEDAAGNLKAV